MLRIQPYQEHRHAEDLKIAFSDIFEEGEIPYCGGLYPELSYVCTARTGTIQGFILVKETPEGVTNYEIAYLGVVPRYRSKGYAQQLLEMVKRKASGKGLWLSVMDSNLGAIRLYEKAGFDVFEKFTSSEGERATRFTFGVEYNCYDCKIVLKPKDARWEETITKYAVVGGNPPLKPICELLPKCWRCRTKIEP